MAKVLVILCLVVLIQIITGESEKCNKNCCFPEVFTAYIGSYSGQPSEPIPGISDTEQVLSFDYPNRRWAFRFRRIQETGEYEELLWVENFKNRKRYVVRNHKCHFQALSSAMRLPCIPNDADILYKDYIGSPLMGIQTETYNYTYKDWNFITTVDPTTCVPLSEFSTYRYNQYSWSRATLDYLDQEADQVLEELFDIDRFSCYPKEALPSNNEEFWFLGGPETKHFSFMFSK
ncbi:DgyrCDS122 [Dimorphilus gyrociliatus]|uniref:DgyrCDS122 n=1 Tax=Dimorphilus gyrociliatus TaxID=2664684 RepID=A0A7I8V3N6_9ANNE|nr:DgyrCDS122 [Dimorphilus gyrociliatus]